MVEIRSDLISSIKKKKTIAGSVKRTLSFPGILNRRMLLKSILLLIVLALSVGQSKGQENAEWQTLGSRGFSPGGALFTCLALDEEGVPYVAYNDLSNGGKATVMKYNGTDWEPVGIAGFSSGAADDISLTLDAAGTPFVAYSDGANNTKATVKKYNGVSWETVGRIGFSEGPAYTLSIVLDAQGTPYVAFVNGSIEYKATVMKYNGTNWETVGTAGFSAGISDDLSLAIDFSGTPYLSYRDYSLDAKATVKKFDGTKWEGVGIAGFSAGHATYTSLALDVDGTPYVTYGDGSNGGKATVMKFDGAGWVSVGMPGFTAGAAYFTSLALDANGMPYVASQDGGNNGKATVMKFNGTSWETVGTAGFSEGSAASTSLALDVNNVPYLAYYEPANSNKVTVKSFVPSDSKEFETTLSAASINENSTANSVVGTFEVADCPCVFSLTNSTGETDNSAFNIISNVLVATSSFDYEVKENYSVHVRAEGCGRSAEKSFTIMVNDVNEAPTAIALSQSDLYESNDNGAAIGNFTSTDQDINDTHNYTFVIGDGDTDNAFFTIEGSTLKAAKVFDYETKYSFSVRILTEDSGGLFYEAVKTITIKDVQEAVTGLSEEENKKLKLFPNPTARYVRVTSNEIIDFIGVVNSYGVNVLDFQIGGTKNFDLDLYSLASGVYTVNVSCKGKMYTRRIVLLK